MGIGGVEGLSVCFITVNQVRVRVDSRPRKNEHHDVHESQSAFDVSRAFSAHETCQELP